MKNKNSRITIKKQKRKRKATKYILLVIGLLLLASITYGVNIYLNARDTANDSYEEDKRGGSALREEIVDPGKDNVSILFIGVDNGGGRGTDNNGLSDALILTTFNRSQKSIKMLSIPRDSYVYIPERDTYTKINHAHSYGGPIATVETIEHLFDIPVDYYVSLNFDAFIHVVNELGGINVDVPYELYEKDSNDRNNGIHLLPGEQLLNGEEALALARTRKMDNDIERGLRQQMIMKAMLDKAISAKTILNINSLISAVGKNIKTSMEFSEIQSFVTYVMNKSLDIEQLELKGSDNWTDAYYYELDEEHLEQLKLTLKDHLDLN